MVCRRCGKSDKGIYARELCTGCYQYCRQQVAGGKTSWDRLVANGWAAPRNSKGRPAEATPVNEMNALVRKELTEEEKLPEIIVECLEPGCGFVTTSTMDSVEHERLTKHRERRLGKKIEVKLPEPSDELTDIVREMANMVLGEGGEEEEGNEEPKFPTGK